jgi:hypothetical protein
MLPLQTQLGQAVCPQLLERDAAEACEAGLVKHRSDQLLRPVTCDTVIADVDLRQGAADTRMPSAISLLAALSPKLVP